MRRRAYSVYTGLERYCRVYHGQHGFLPGRCSVASTRALERGEGVARLEAMDALKRDRATGLLNLAGLQQDFATATRTRLPVAVHVLSIERLDAFARARGFRSMDVLLEDIARRLSDCRCRQTSAFQAEASDKGTRTRTSAFLVTRYAPEGLETLGPWPQVDFV